MNKLLLFDLDGTLLTSKKTITNRTVEAILKCKDKGYLIGVCTSRGESSVLTFINQIHADILIVNGGSVVKYKDEYIYKKAFTVKRTNEIIELVRKICGFETEITVDTIDKFYWHYKESVAEEYKNFGEIIKCDFRNFNEEALKITAEIKDIKQENKIRSLLTDCDFEGFRDSYWRKFTLKGISKENGISILCSNTDIKYEDIIAFGDDLADIEMLKIVGVGVAVGNALDEVKAVSDIVIKSNDEEGVAEYLESLI